MKCVFFASLRSQKEAFGGICDYVPTYFITEQGNLIICCKGSKILRNAQCLLGDILLRYFNLTNWIVILKSPNLNIDVVCHTIS